MKNFILLLVMLLIYSFSIAQTPPFIANQLDDYIEKGMKLWQIPGVAVCIVKDGKVVHSKGYGVLENGKSKKVDKNTLFMIGSNTKAFTATAVAKLHFEQKCNLEDKVVKWLPDFQLKDPCITKEVNLADMLSHRMGYETFQGDFMYWTSDLSRDEVLEKFGQLTPVYNFRNKWGYTNAGFVVAGKYIEKISGKSWNEYMKTEFFQPLEMSRTIALYQDIEGVNNMSKAHTKISNEIKTIPYCNIDNIAPAASIFSSVEDMSHWVLALLDDGVYNENKAIPKRAFLRTWKAESILGQSYHPYNKSNFKLYGLGWVLQDYEGRKIVSHTGGVNGFVSSVTLIPSEKLGIVILTNTDCNTIFISSKLEIIDAYLKLPFRDYNSFFYNNSQKYENADAKRLIELKDSVALNLKPDLEISEYAGKYTHQVYGDITLTEHKNKLIITFEHHSNLTATLESLGGNRFLCTYNDPAFGIKIFPFHIENKQVKYLTLSVADVLEFTKYRFVKN